LRTIRYREYEHGRRVSPNPAGENGDDGDVDDDDDGDGDDEGGDGTDSPPMLIFSVSDCAQFASLLLSLT
jgi:hypothetical protein